MIGPVQFQPERGLRQADSNGAVPGAYVQSFSFPVYQQSTAGDGKVVISNISYTTLADALTGPVQVSVWGIRWRARPP